MFLGFNQLLRTTSLLMYKTRQRRAALKHFLLDHIMYLRYLLWQNLGVHINVNIEKCQLIILLWNIEIIFIKVLIINYNNNIMDVKRWNWILRKRFRLR